MFFKEISSLISSYTESWLLRKAETWEGKTSWEETFQQNEVFIYWPAHFKTVYDKPVQMLKIFNICTWLEMRILIKFLILSFL